MKRNEIIQKTMIKLSMIGAPEDAINDATKKMLLKRLWNDREPRNVIRLVQTLFRNENTSKEGKQDLFKFFKSKGLFKRTLQFPNMEKAWRLLLKESNLQGFLLEV